MYFFYVYLFNFKECSINKNGIKQVKMSYFKRGCGQIVVCETSVLKDFQSKEIVNDKQHVTV